MITSFNPRGTCLVLVANEKEFQMSIGTTHYNTQRHKENVDASKGGKVIKEVV